MEELIKRLPEELRQYILSFTYNPQSFVLLNDVQHYTRTRPIIQEWYTNRFAWEYPNAEHDWLNNDLLGFCNEHHASMFGYRDHYIEIFKRLFLLKDKPREQVLSKSNRYSAKTNNTIWGILTVKEREAFISHWEI